LLTRKTINGETGHIEQSERYELGPANGSKFGQILLNQGAIEQVFNDHLNSKGNIRVEWNKEAEPLHFQ
jgi:phenol 2-monooxygenase